MRVCELAVMTIVCHVIILYLHVNSAALSTDFEVCDAVNCVMLVTGSVWSKQALAIE